jgi:hypothetical protein
MNDKIVPILAMVEVACSGRVAKWRNGVDALVAAMLTIHCWRLSIYMHTYNLVDED